jgi:hypothetical protein
MSSPAGSRTDITGTSSPFPVGPLYVDWDGVDSDDSVEESYDMVDPSLSFRLGVKGGEGRSGRDDFGVELYSQHTSIILALECGRTHDVCNVSIISYYVVWTYLEDLTTYPSDKARAFGWLTWRRTWKSAISSLMSPYYQDYSPSLSLAPSIVGRSFQLMATLTVDKLILDKGTKQCTKARTFLP